MLDKSAFDQLEPSVTIVSIYWTDLNEFKPGLIPQNFVIKAPKPGEAFTVTHISRVINNHYIGEGKSLQIPINPYEIGNAIVEDFLNAKLESKSVQEPHAHPGLMVLPGILTKEEVLKKYGTELENLRKSQTAWANRLVRRANDEWQRSGQQQRAIALDQVLAAKSLGLKPAWVQESSGKLCPGCEASVSATAPKCMHCGCILDEEKYKQLKFAV